MNTIIRRSSIAVILLASATLARGEETVLFNGKDLEGWSFHVDDEEKEKDVTRNWIVQDGLLVSTGASTNYLMHKTAFENYELTLEWRSMKARNGLIIGGVGSVLIHTSPEEGAFGYPKSVEISLRRMGHVFLRGIDIRTTKNEDWVFRAPDVADDAEHDLGEWNQLKLICRDKHLTVFVNGTPVNQIDKLNRTKGSVAIRATRGAPLYYRNIKVQPLTAAVEKTEQAAAAKLAEIKAAVEAKEAARVAQQKAEELKEKARQDALDKLWVKIDVKPSIEFKPDALQLPFPADAKEFDFQATFGDIRLKSATSMETLSKFFRTEMARRGWEEADKKRDERSVTVNFKHGAAKVKMYLSKQRDGSTNVSLDTDGLSFDGSSDPAKLAALGIPQPPAYLALQKEFKLPEDAQGLKYDSGNRCLFKCSLKLQESFDNFSGQLKAKGYRETRRPIKSDNRRYTEFGKGRVKVSVNVFEDNVGSRVILTYESR